MDKLFYIDIDKMSHSMFLACYKLDKKDICIDNSNQTKFGDYCMSA